MEKQMNQSKLKAGLIITILVLVALFAAFWAASIVFRPQQSFVPTERRVPPSGIIPGDFEFFYIAQTIVSTINISILIILIITFASIYTKTRSQFTIGLLIFASAFLMKDVASNPLITQAFGYRVFGLGPFALLPELFEAAALSVLLYLNIKY
jgi:hypothetical protein